MSAWKQQLRFDGQDLVLSATGCDERRQWISVKPLKGGARVRHKYTVAVAKTLRRRLVDEKVPTDGGSWDVVLFEYINTIAAKASMSREAVKESTAPSDLKLKQLSGARSRGVAWTGEMPELLQVGYCIRQPTEEQLPAATRATLMETHERALPSSKAGTHVHETTGARTTQLAKCGLKLQPDRLTFQDMRKKDIAAVKMLRMAMAASAGQPHTALGTEAVKELTVLRFDEGHSNQQAHIDGPDSFLGCIYNPTDEPIAATEFLDHPPHNYYAGFDQNSTFGKVNRKKLIEMMKRATAPTAAFRSAGIIPPGAFLFTNPLHVHKAPVCPPKTRSKIKKTRRIFFGAFVSKRSAEYEVICATDDPPWWQAEGLPNFTKGELTAAGYWVG